MSCVEVLALLYKAFVSVIVSFIYHISGGDENIILIVGHRDKLKRTVLSRTLI